jgi:hypothetical protein
MKTSKTAQACLLLLLVALTTGRAVALAGGDCAAHAAEHDPAAPAQRYAAVAMHGAPGEISAVPDETDRAFVLGPHADHAGHNMTLPTDGNSSSCCDTACDCPPAHCSSTVAMLDTGWASHKILPLSGYSLAARVQLQRDSSVPLRPPIPA